MVLQLKYSTSFINRLFQMHFNIVICVRLICKIVAHCGFIITASSRFSFLFSPWCTQFWLNTLLVHFRSCESFLPEKNIPHLFCNAFYYSVTGKNLLQNVCKCVFCFAVNIFYSIRWEEKRDSANTRER